MAKKVKFCAFTFDMFEAQTESLCKRHCEAPTVIFFDHGVRQIFSLPYTVPG